MQSSNKLANFKDELKRYYLLYGLGFVFIGFFAPKFIYNPLGYLTLSGTIISFHTYGLLFYSCYFVFAVHRYGKDAIPMTVLICCNGELIFNLTYLGAYPQYLSTINNIDDIVFNIIVVIAIIALTGFFSHDQYSYNALPWLGFGIFFVLWAFNGFPLIYGYPHLHTPVFSGLYWEFAYQLFLSYSITLAYKKKRTNTNESSSKISTE